MAIDISGINFFMPILIFLFIFVILYAILAKTKIIGDNKFVHLLISFIISIVFMSFSSINLYVKTIIPWFAVMVVIVFFVLVVAGFSTKSWDKIMTPAFAWVVIGILIIIFLLAAIRVFNPVFHPDLGITEGNGNQSLIQQISSFLVSSNIAGGILLIIVAIIISWILTKG
jgi:hypothetical protein